MKYLCITNLCAYLYSTLIISLKNENTVQKQNIIESLELLIYLIEKNTECIEMSMPESVEYQKAVELLATLKEDEKV